MRIGILALQGDFQEHRQTFALLGVPAVEVRRPHELEQVDALVIPGGESTAMGIIARSYGLIEPLRAMASTGRPIWGTCAGLILMAADIGGGPPHLGVMDVAVKRNAFGRQVASFEADLAVPALGNGTPFHAVFIRAPRIVQVGAGVQVLAELPSSGVVAARQGRLLATCFHPELTTDSRFHRYFLKICASS